MTEALVLCVITLIVVFFYAVGITIEFHKIRAESCIVYVCW